MPVGPQSHPDESRTDTSRSRRHQAVLINTAEVATMLSVSTSWVHREASKLALKGYRLGRGRNAKACTKGPRPSNSWISRKCDNGKWAARTSTPICLGVS